MIYLDNSATTYPKPKQVIDSFNISMQKYGANFGRGIYDMSIKTAEQVFNVREKVADFFGVPSVEKVVFTSNCTHALNIAIKGVAKQGCHFIISDLEHNSVLRPLEKLKNKLNCEYSIAKVEKSIEKTISNFEKLIKNNTVAIICTGASNVFGILTPFKELAKVAHKHNILFILDASQIAGLVPIDMKKDDIDIICCAGHKYLYGPVGTGLLLLNENVNLDTLMEGGSGSNSLELSMPIDTPDRFESGTLNSIGIIGLGKGLDFLNNYKTDEIYKHEFVLMNNLYSFLNSNNYFKTYCGFQFKTVVPIISFNVKGYNSELVASELSKEDIAVRSGLHCASLAHQKFNTTNSGTIRISPSIFTKKYHIDLLIKSLIKIAKSN